MTNAQAAVLKSLEAYTDKVARWHNGGVPRREIDEAGKAFFDTLDAYVEQKVVSTIQHRVRTSASGKVH